MRDTRSKKNHDRIPARGLSKSEIAVLGVRQRKERSNQACARGYVPYRQELGRRNLILGEGVMLRRKKLNGVTHPKKNINQIREVEIGKRVDAKSYAAFQNLGGGKTRLLRATTLMIRNRQGNFARVAAGGW